MPEPVAAAAASAERRDQGGQVKRCRAGSVSAGRPSDKARSVRPLALAVDRLCWRGSCAHRFRKRAASSAPTGTAISGRRRGRGSRRAKVDQRGVGFMPHRRDQRDAAVGGGADDRFLVEAPRVLQAAAARATMIQIRGAGSGRPQAVR